MAIRVPTEIELHDAIVKALDINFEAGEVNIGVAYYRSEDESERQIALIRFQGVRLISATCDLRRLLDNSRAGNINSWRPDQGDGITYIYLLDGCISIEATSVSFEN